MVYVAQVTLRFNGLIVKGYIRKDGKFDVLRHGIICTYADINKLIAAYSV